VGRVSEINQTLSGHHIDNHDYQESKYPVLIYNRDGQTTHEYMAVGGHIVLNKSDNCMENC
jgi:hypothetical protein